MILWTVAHQDPLSMGSSRQEYWSGLPLLLQVTFPPQGLIEPSSPVSPALAGRSLPLSHLRSPDLLTVCLSSLMVSSTSAPGHFLGTARLQVTAWTQPVTYRNIVCSLKPPPSFSFRTTSTGIWANVLSLDSRGLCNWGLRQKTNRNQLY